MHSGTWLLLIINLESTCWQCGAAPHLAEDLEDTLDDCAEQRHPMDTSFLQSHLQLNSSATRGKRRDQKIPTAPDIEAQIRMAIDMIEPRVDAAKARIMISIFLFALFLVAAEDIVAINKSAVMMLTAGVLWTYLIVSYKPSRGFGLNEELNDSLLDTASTILFLLPAMGVVEAIDHVDGFVPITSLVSSNRKCLMPMIFVMTFALSSVIDNLTSTIIAVKILKTLIPDDKEFRKHCGALAVIASNSGGAWSPMGDVTTTMLWVEDRISVAPTMRMLLLPSVLCGVLPLAGLMWQARRSSDDKKEHPCENVGEPERVVVSYREAGALTLGFVCILMVPVLKMQCGLPPYLGMLSALGLFWLLTDLLGITGTKESGDDDMEHHGLPQGAVVTALKKIELTGLLFITGVLLAVGALNGAGVLHHAARVMTAITGGSPVSISILLGLSSAVVDNVPLVDASIDMFKGVPKDDPLWQLVALSAGTGGSILSIGSMAGVLLMSMEDVSFMWYCRNASFWAVSGFFLGIGLYRIEMNLFG